MTTFPPGAVTLPRLALDDVCTAKSVDGWVCTRAAGHTGRHAACGLGGRLIEVWPNETPAAGPWGSGSSAGTTSPATETGAGP